MKRIILELAICSFLLLGLYSLPIAEGAIEVESVTLPVLTMGPYSPAPQETQEQEKKVGMQIWINRIAVQAPIVPVGLRADGAMDIPKSVDEVGWYSLGAAPGMQRNTVLAGHLNGVGGVRGVFWDIDALQPGDEILIGESWQTALRYKVIYSSSYPYNEFPMETVFGGSSEKILRLITCAGEWEKDKGMYDNRLVVTAVQQ